MAKPYQEGAVWSFRLRIQGEDIYRTGYATEAAARAAEAELRAEKIQRGKAVGDGPFKTRLASAFSHYAANKLPYLKGALPDSRIINRYLRAAGLPVIRLKRADKTEGTTKIYWAVAFEHEPERKIPPSLRQHRSEQEAAAYACDAMRRRLATLPVAEVTAYEIQSLISEMLKAGYKTSTIANERAQLRRLFTYTNKTLNWSHPRANPPSGVDMPPADPPRDTVLSNAQWRRLSIELCKAGNAYAPIHTMRRTKASLIYRRTKNLRAVQLLLGHTKLESTVRYLGIEVDDDALEMAEQTEV